MRKIKFRAWSNDDGIAVMNSWTSVKRNFRQYLTEPSHGVPANGFHQYNHLRGKRTEYHLMQFIGTEDKEGNEIYEGDILMDNEGDYFTVKWNYLDCGFFLVAKTTFEAPDDPRTVWYYPRMAEIMKVVGNIHEPPPDYEAVGEKMLDTRLKPCPFCGSDDIRLRDGGDREESWVWCSDCGCSTDGRFVGAKWAIKAWNRRVGRVDKSSREGKRPPQAQLELFTEIT